MSKSDGGPAFPTDQTRSLHKTPSVSGGMSLRDWFAGQALARLVESGVEQNFPEEHIAGVCYRIADAMLKHRDGGEL